MKCKESDSKIEDWIKTIFEELKDKGLVNENHDLVPGSEFESQKFLLTKRKKIYYPKEKLEKKELSDDAFRWTLLHEEAHLTINKGHQYFLSILLPIVFLSSIIYLFSDSRIPLVIIGITLGISIILCNVPKLDFLRQVEYDCDRWAAEKMKKHYGKQKPTELVKNLVKWYKETKSKKNIIIRVFRKPFKLLFDPHPNLCKRIKNLKDLDEDF